MERSRRGATTGENLRQDGRRPAGAGARGVTAFSFSPVPPFRLDLTVWALRRRADNVVDRWDGRRYRRVLDVGEGVVEIAAVQAGAPERPRLVIEVAATHPAPPGSGAAARRAVERLLGVGTDLSDFYRRADRDPRLRRLVVPYRGVKPPRFPTLFEALVNAVACQQLSLAVGIRLLNRLAEACGRPFPAVGGTAHAFPRPADVAALGAEPLRRLGFNRAKVRALLELAAAVAGRRVDPGALEAADDATVVSRLTELRGIGRWSAEYALLRGLGRLHVFPGDDAGARNGLRRWLRLGDAPGYDRIRRLLARWEPYAGLIYFHLLLARLEHAGLVSPAPTPAPREETGGGR